MTVRNAARTAFARWFRDRPFLDRIEYAVCAPEDRGCACTGTVEVVDGRETGTPKT